MAVIHEYRNPLHGWEVVAMVMLLLPLLRTFGAWIEGSGWILNWNWQRQRRRWWW